jgi:PAS domain S-box-containing protein
MHRHVDNIMMQDYQQELTLIKDLLKKNPEGMSVTDIAKALKKNKNTTGRYLDILLISGQVDMRTYGMAKVFTLSQRVPLSAMLSYSKELIMVLDKESRIIDVNDHFLHLLDLTRRDTIGKNLRYLKTPNVNVHELLHVLSKENQWPEENIAFTVKGQGERIFKQQRIPTVFDDGAKGVTILLEDVTERIRNEQEIREREERFRMMAENIQDGLVILENKKNVFVNSRIAEITGYLPEELSKIDPLSIIAPEDRGEVEKQRERLENLIEGTGEFQALIRRKDGVYRNVYVRITVLSRGKIRYEFVIMTDITELKAKDSALRESEQRFRMMAENIQDGLVIIENEQIVYANRRSSEITGYTMEELQQKRSVDLISPEDRHTIEELLKNSIAGTAPAAEFQVWVLCKNGDRRCIHGRINSMRRGDTLSTYLTMTDLTTFAERERALLDRIQVLQEHNHQNLYGAKGSEKV